MSGVVQGVGFRWWTRQQARRLELSGVVRNTEDGCVEVVAAGPPEDLDRLHRLLQQGPPGARVESVRELPASSADLLPEPFAIER